MFGGHCLPIDPSYLAWRVKRHLGYTFRFVELANDVNEHMPDYVHSRVTALLNRSHKSVNGKRILLLELAYKRGTSDWRESPSVAIPNGWPTPTSSWCSSITSNSTRPQSRSTPACCSTPRT